MTYLLLDTSTPTCKVTLHIDGTANHYEWEAGRTLAHGLLGYLEDKLLGHGLGWRDITGIGMLRGPGSFTGLRIGMAVANTVADALQIPIVGVVGENWEAAALVRLQAGEDDRVVLPEYGGDAHITAPRK